MPKILKPYEAPVDLELAREILKIPIDVAEYPIPRTIGERVELATKAVEEANAYLEKSPVAALMAETLMRKLKKRGDPSIRVAPDGTVMLHISYTGAKSKPIPAPVTRTTRKSNLPSLTELKDEAESMGIDISDLGKKRREIHNRIEAAKSGDKPPERMVDESKQSEPPPNRPKVIRRPANPSRAPAEELDVDELLDG